MFKKSRRNLYETSRIEGKTDIVVHRKNFRRYQLWYQSVHMKDFPRVCFNCRGNIEKGDTYHKPYEGRNHMHSLCAGCTGVHP